MVVSHDFTEIDGVKVFYRAAGDANAPAVLLLHGFPTSSHMYRNLIPALADGYRVVAPDLPGFGFSDSPDRARFTYSFDHLAAFVERFTEAVGLDRFAVMVFDYGAPIGFRLALRHPERISAIITQNGNAYAEGLSAGFDPMRAYWAEPNAANRAALRGLLQAETTKWQYTAGAPDPAAIAPETYTLDQALLDRPGNDEIQLDLFGDYGSNVALYPAIHAYFRAHRPKLLAVWGRNDPFFLPEGAEAFRRDLPDAEIHLLDAGHFALESNGKEIAHLVRDFLDRHVAGARASTEGLVRGFYDALGRGDAPAALGLLADEISWTETPRFPYFSGTWTRPQQVLENLLIPADRDWDGFAAVAKRYIAAGDTIVALGDYGGTHRISGKPMSAPFAHVWTAAGGKLTGFIQYTDTALVLEATR